MPRTTPSHRTPESPRRDPPGRGHVTNLPTAAKCAHRSGCDLLQVKSSSVPLLAKARADRGGQSCSVSGTSVASAAPPSVRRLPFVEGEHLVCAWKALILSGHCSGGRGCGSRGPLLWATPAVPGAVEHKHPARPRLPCLAATHAMGTTRSAPEDRQFC